MGIDDIAGLADMCDVEELQEVVEYCLGCNPNMKYHYQDASRYSMRTLLLWAT